MSSVSSSSSSSGGADTTAEHEIKGETRPRDMLKLAARIGYASRGLVYLVIGGLALYAAVSAATPEGTRGAIAALFGHPAGRVLGYGLVVGLVLYALWRFWQSLTDTDDHGLGVKGLAVRGGLLASGVTYLLLAGFALRLALGLATNEDGSQDGVLPDWITFERWMLMIAALVPIGIGVAHIWKGAKAKFERHFLCDESRMRWVRPLSRTGLIARGFVFFIIAFLLAWGGRDYEPDAPPSSEDALDYLEGLSLGGVTIGPWLLGALGLGLVAFALYSIAEAAYRRVRFD